MASAYTQFLEKELILRDRLAVDRTILANERTFLSYIRTSLTLIIAGVTVIKLIPEELFIGLGWISIIVGGVILIAGAMRYKKFQQSISILSV